MELNPDTYPDTFIGHNEKGAAIFRLFPEAKDVVEGDIPDPEEESAVSRMVVTFVNEYMGENAQDIVNESIAKYIEEHPIVNGEDGVGVSSAYIDASGRLILTYTNGSTATVGYVVGADGKDGRNGKDGVTFTPKVDAEGNLSWTNDGARENPAVVNIRGRDGKDGKDGLNGQDGKDGKDGATVAEVLADVPAASSAKIAKADDGTITITMPMNDGTTSTCVLTPGADGFPVVATIGGVAVPIAWEGW